MASDLGGQDTDKKLIMIVDDDPTQLAMMKQFLEPKYKVVLLPSGRDAINYLIDHKPDVILLDYMMPLYNGVAVLNIIRSKESTKDIPVFFLTGQSDTSTVMQCLALKPAGYIVKPVGRKDIIKKLEAWFYEHG
ncbi:MAG: response regulator [Lachnospiraceae bacterium]|nr:response regulator [Lachnospiraceae bacterium]